MKGILKIYLHQDLQKLTPIIITIDLENFAEFAECTDLPFHVGKLGPIS